MEPLTVPGSLDSLSVIGQYVLSAAAAAGLDKKAAYRLRLAVDEIATNAIIHGYHQANLKGDLDLRAIIDETTLTIFLEDTGPPYNPDQISKKIDLRLPLEKREVGGLGLSLAVQGVDKFHYERSGERNRHTFVVNRGAASAKE
jgi:serine/threonine-protein kinase RsbW